MRSPNRGQGVRGMLDLSRFSKPNPAYAEPCPFFPGTVALISERQGRLARRTSGGFYETGSTVQQGGYPVRIRPPPTHARFRQTQREQPAACSIPDTAPS